MYLFLYVRLSFVFVDVSCVDTSWWFLVTSKISRSYTTYEMAHCRRCIIHQSKPLAGGDGSVFIHTLVHSKIQAYQSSFKRS